MRAFSSTWGRVDEMSSVRNSINRQRSDEMIIMAD